MPAASLTSSMLRCEILKPGLPCTGVQIYVLGVVLTRGNVTLPGINIRGGSTTVPSAGYADLPPGIDFEPKDEPRRRDINLLGRVLGRILIEQEGERTSSRPRKRSGSFASACASTTTPNWTSGCGDGSTT